MILQGKHGPIESFLSPERIQALENLLIIHGLTHSGQVLGGGVAIFPPGRRHEAVWLNIFLTEEQWLEDVQFASRR